MSIRKTFLRTLTLGVAVTALLSAEPVQAKVEGDTIVLGSAISFTGKYATNGIDNTNGKNFLMDIPEKHPGISR